MTSRRIALFDLDHTLLPLDSDYQWADFLARTGRAGDPEEARRRNDDLMDRYNQGELTAEQAAYLGVPIEGSLPLFLLAAALQLFATTSMGIFLATVAGSMPQFGLLLILVLLPLQVLSGGTTPRESMPEIIQTIMLAAPNTHFVILGQAILFRGAGIAVVWPQFLALFAIGCVLFSLAYWRFRAFLR